MVKIEEALEIERISDYYGFDDSAQLTIIETDVFESYDNILMIGDSDIVNRAKGLYDRTSATGKTSFSLIRNNLMKAKIHWAQDFRKIIRTPPLVGIRNSAKFRTEIEVASQRDSIRKHSLEESSKLIKDADLGKIKRHKYCITCSRELNNYLLNILGQDGVPLRYVVREYDAPDYTLEPQPNYDFDKL